MSRTIIVFAVLAVLVIGLGFAAFIVFSRLAESGAKTGDTRIQKFADEFPVGSSSRDFITRARNLGALNYAVVPGDPALIKAHKSEKAKVEPEWFAASLDPVEKLDQLESKFKTLPDGSASVIIVVDPPNGRRGCHIDFKNGKVIEVHTYSLDGF